MAIPAFVEPRRPGDPPTLIASNRKAEVAVAQIERPALPPLVQILQSQQMGLHQVPDVNVIPDTGAVGGGVVVAKEGDPPTLIASNRKAEEALGWKPRRDLEQMIHDAWVWHKEHPKSTEKALFGKENQYILS